jgi:hypothetical protein
MENVRYSPSVLLILCGYYFLKKKSDPYFFHSIFFLKKYPPINARVGEYYESVHLAFSLISILTLNLHVDSNFLLIS